MRVPALLLILGLFWGLGAPQARWAAGADVLVWVDQASAPPGATGLVDRAMTAWTRAAAGTLALRRTDRRAEGAMRIRFASSPGLYGETRPRIDPRTGAIVGAEVVIATGTGGDDPIMQRIVIYLTALHEIGHGIGMRHTDDFSDIMYSFRRPDDGDRYFGAYRGLLRSPADIGSPQISGLSANDIAAVRATYGR